MFFRKIGTYWHPFAIKFSWFWGWDFGHTSTCWTWARWPHKLDVLRCQSTLVKHEGVDFNLASQIPPSFHWITNGPIIWKTSMIVSLSPLHFWPVNTYVLQSSSIFLFTSNPWGGERNPRIFQPQWHHGPPWRRLGPKGPLPIWPTEEKRQSVSNCIFPVRAKIGLRSDHCHN